MAEQLTLNQRVEGSSPSGLTTDLSVKQAYQARVVGLPARGPQIADALFITRKTASVHVSNILGKFGVSNRVEAAAIAYRIGLGDDLPLIPPTPAGASQPFRK